MIRTMVIFTLLLLFWGCSNDEKQAKVVKHRQAKAKKTAQSKKIIIPHGAAKLKQQLLPLKINGFTLQGEQENYTRKNIFDLVNGGAEVYLKKGLIKAVAGTYKSINNVEVEVQLFNFKAEKGTRFLYAKKTKDLPGAKGVITSKPATSLIASGSSWFISIVVTSTKPSNGTELAKMLKTIAEKANMKIVMKTVRYKK